MRSAAADVADAGADIIDLNMGCPVPKVMKTGAGAALIDDPARRGRGRARGPRGLGAAGHRQAARVGAASRASRSQRLVDDAGVPGSRSTRARPPCATRAPGLRPRRRLVQELPVPVIVTGGMEGATTSAGVRHTGCAAVMLARGALRQSVAVRAGARRPRRPRAREEIVAEWEWWSIARRSTSGPSAPHATCASSIRGTSSGSALERRAGRASSAPTRSPKRAR